MSDIDTSNAVSAAYPPDDIPVAALPAILRSMSGMLNNLGAVNAQFFEDVVDGDFVYFSPADGFWYPAVGSTEVLSPVSAQRSVFDSANKPLLGVASRKHQRVFFDHLITTVQWSFTPGSVQYLSTTKAGKLTEVANNSPVGIAIAPHTLFVFTFGSSIERELKILRDIVNGLQASGGQVVLSDRIDLDSSTTAASSKAVKTVVDMLDSISGSPTDVMYIDAFTTDGISTDYRVGDDIVLDPNAANLFLVLGGMAQEPVADYTIVGKNTIRFSEAPHANLRCWGLSSLNYANPDIRAAIDKAILKVNDEADYIINQAKAWAESSLPPDPKDPFSKSAKSWAKEAAEIVKNIFNVSNATIVVPGTSAVRTLADRFGDVINVKDFGALGNDNNDDTKAFLNAESMANARGVKQIFVPIGTYRITSLSAIRLNMFFGLGLLVSDNGVSHQLYISGDNTAGECESFAAEAKIAAQTAIEASKDAADYRGSIMAMYEAIMGKETFDALYLVNQFAPQMIASVRHDIESYNNWYDGCINQLTNTSVVAMQMQQRCHNTINGYVRDLRLHRLQLTAADGQTPYLFIVAGQSNAVGYGKDANGGYESAVDVAQFWAWNENPALLKPLKDPVYKSVKGSAWPAFCRRFFELTGRKVYIINVASGGAAVTDGGYTTDNTWADNTYGTLRATARTQFEALKAHLEQQQLPFEIGGLLWCQGETEGGRIAAGRVSVKDYVDGSLDVFAFFRELTGKATLDVFVSKIGFSTTTLAPGTPVHDGYVAVQEAQEKLCRDNAHVHMAFRLAPTFFDVGYMSDTIHYNQTGYNMMGEALASCAATTLNI